MEKGNTALILNPFLEGMKEAGAEVELFYPKNLKINSCQGDGICLFKTPGKCFQNDDMQQIFPKADADIIVLATPLYLDGMTASLKVIAERLMMTRGLPNMELIDGACRHPFREGTVPKNGKVVLVSNCGYWGIENFGPLVEQVKAISKNWRREFAGALLRPHGPILGGMLKMGAPVQDILDAAKEAGRQLVQEGQIKEETLKIVSRELIPLNAYVQGINQRIAAFAKAN